jgi:hypothetical protein
MHTEIYAQTGSGTKKKNIKMESKRVKKAKVSTTIRLAGNYQSGNTEKTSATIAAVAAVEDSIKEFSTDVKFTYGENANKVNQREFFGGLTYDYLPLSKLSPFARIELYSNVFKKISMRHSGLAGAKYRYFKRRKPSFSCDYSFSMALIYDNEDYTKDAKVPDTNKF